MGALYFGVGKAVGGLVGGLVIDWIGVRVCFRYKRDMSIFTHGTL